MNNKGFTLTELLAIVGIIAIIMIVAAPNMTKLINKETEERNTILEKKVQNASKIYAAKYYASDLITNGYATFKLNDLEKEGLIDLKCDDDVMTTTITFRPNLDPNLSPNISNLLKNCN